jgi:hypothetical protein
MYVQSLGWDPGHHEELWNGSGIRNPIWESYFRILEMLGIFSYCITIKDVLEGSRGGVPVVPTFQGGAWTKEVPY